MYYKIQIPKYATICMQCNQRIINYLNQLCRRQFHPPSQINKYKLDRRMFYQFLKIAFLFYFPLYL